MSGSSGGGSGMSANRIIGIVLAIVGGVFILSNRESADVGLAFINITVPLWVAMGVTFLIGIGAGALIFRRKG